MSEPLGNFADGFLPRHFVGVAVAPAQARVVQTVRTLDEFVSPFARLAGVAEVDASLPEV